MTTHQESEQSLVGSPTTHSCRAIYEFRIDGGKYESSAALITGEKILELAHKSPNEYCLFLKKKKDGIRRIVGADEEVDLSEPGVERFKTRKAIPLCIEDKTLPWCKRTITTEEIATLGSWDVSQGVVEVDDEQNERTLEPGEIVKLRPGQQFGKKHCWKRGQ